MTDRAVATPARQFPRALEALLGLALLAWFTAAVVTTARNTSATFDEPIHLASGVSYDRFADFRFNPEHPPLIKVIAALPWVWADAWPHDLSLRDTDLRDTPQWDADRTVRRMWALGLQKRGLEMGFGEYVLYGTRPELLTRGGTTLANTLNWPPEKVLTRGDFLNDTAELLPRARLMLLPLGWLLALLVWAWARELFGAAGGLLALAGFCADPNFTAHCGLVTTDAGISLCVFATIYFLWRALHHASFVNVAGLCVSFGLAFTVKFSAALLVPMFGLAALGWTIARQRESSSGRAACWRCARLFVGASLTAWLLVWAVYGFRFSAATDPAQAARDEVRAGAVTAPGGAPGQLPPVQGAVPNFFRAHRLLPEAFIFGLAAVKQGAPNRLAYLWGQFSSGGFWSYFGWTFLLKTPLVMLGLMLAGALATWRRHGEGRMACWFLLSAAGFYFAVAVGMRFNIGHRHLLPVYPFLFVLAGGAVLLVRRAATITRWLSGLVVLTLVLVGGRVVFYPQPAMAERPAQRWQLVGHQPLAYFNELAGGPVNGSLALVDSNLDWGQGLVDLRHWLAARGETAPVALCYFGLSDPRAYGFAHVNLPEGFFYEPRVEFAAVRPGQLLVVSATKRAGVYLSPENHDALRQLLARSTLLDCVGYSLFVYRYDGPKS